MIKSKIISIVAIGIIILATAGILYFSKSSEPASYSVVSPDGEVTLEIPSQALPKGVSNKDIHVRRLETGEIPGSISKFNTAAVYSLEPHGIIFTKPVSVSVAYNSVSNVMPFLLHFDGDTATVPRKMAVSVDYTNKKAVYSGYISSFSFLMLVTDIGWSAPLALELPEDLGTHMVGESFPVTASIVKFNASRRTFHDSAPSIQVGSYEIIFGGDGEVVYSFTEDPKVTGRFNAIGPVEPKQYIDAPALSAVTGIVEEIERDFTCTEEGSALISYSLSAAVHIKSDLYTNFNLASDAVDTLLNWIASDDRDFVVNGKIAGTAKCVPPPPKLSSFPMIISCGGSVQFSGYIDNAASVESVQITLLGQRGFVASDGGPLKKTDWYEITFAVKPGTYKYEVLIRTKDSSKDIKETGKVTVEPCPKEKEKDSFGEVGPKPEPIIDPGFEKDPVLPPKDTIPKITIPSVEDSVTVPQDIIPQLTVPSTEDTIETPVQTLPDSEEEAPPSQSIETPPSLDICCLNPSAPLGERYYIPFDGNGCLPGDLVVPLDNDCNNPLLY